MKRSGFADLPLHGGRVPDWLAERMTKLGTAIAESILFHYGSSELLSRLSDPFWFQTLGCVMGMDWHSSGITTSVLGAPTAHVNAQLGLGERVPVDAPALVRASRLVAKVDSAAVQDG